MAFKSTSPGAYTTSAPPRRNACSREIVGGMAGNPNEARIRADPMSHALGIKKVPDLCKPANLRRSEAISLDAIVISAPSPRPVRGPAAEAHDRICGHRRRFAQRLVGNPGHPAYEESHVAGCRRHLARLRVAVRVDREESVRVLADDLHAGERDRRLHPDSEERFAEPRASHP